MVAFASSALMSRSVQILGAAATGSIATTGVAIAWAGLAIATGGVLVGADNITYYCWKQVVHNKSITPSKGIELNDLLNNSNVVEFYEENQKMVIEINGMKLLNYRVLFLIV